jgi:hypothetical protein
MWQACGDSWILLHVNREVEAKEDSLYEDPLSKGGAVEAVDFDSWGHRDMKETIVKKVDDSSFRWMNDSEMRVSTRVMNG